MAEIVKRLFINNLRLSISDYDISMNVLIKVSIGSYMLSSYRKKQQYTYLGVKSGSRLLVYRNAGASVLRACACVTIYSSALRFVLMYVKSNKFLIQKFFTKFLSKGKTLLFQYLVCPKFFLYIILILIYIYKF